MAKRVVVPIDRANELLARVLAQRLEKEEAVVAERLDEALLDQRRDMVEIGPGDGLGGVERERSAKDRQPAERRLLVGREEIVAPLDRRAQRPLALWQVACAAGEE